MLQKVLLQHLALRLWRAGGSVAPAASGRLVVRLRGAPGDARGMPMTTVAVPVRPRPLAVFRIDLPRFATLDQQALRDLRTPDPVAAVQATAQAPADAS